MSLIRQTALGNSGYDVEYVQLTVHLVSGGKHRFIQTNPEAAHALLEHLRPERIFAQKQILIAGVDAVTVFATDSVERIDLRSDPLPEWPHAPGVSSIREVSQEDFDRIRRREHVLPTAGTLPSAGAASPPMEIGVAAELQSGSVVHLSVRPQSRRPGNGDAPLTPDDAQAFLRHLFGRPVLFGRMEDEPGLLLINPANAVRFVLAPPPPVHSLTSVWPMDEQD